MNQKLFRNRSEFREWLEENARSNEGVWLVFGKKDKPETLKASEALEEALCFGWIDGQLQSVDENTYLKYFKQRSRTSNWAENNKNLVEKLESQGLMTDLGRVKIEMAKTSGRWNPPKTGTLTDEQLQQFDDMLSAHETAHANYHKMPHSARKSYAASYFFGAKTEVGKQKRFTTIIERLDLNLNPMESMKKGKESMLAIRKATAKDAQDLKELYFGHLTLNPPLEQQDMDKWCEMINRFEIDDHYHLLVGQIGEKIVASVTMVIIENLTHNRRPYAIIENVVTHADYRGQHYATALMDKAREIAEQFGCYKITLTTGSKTESTWRFYENCGFSRNEKTAFIKRLS